MTPRDDLALAWIGLPEEFFRALEPVRAGQARNDFGRYVRTTLEHNQRAGGRFNQPGEFGALYTTSDEPTAWSELHARFLREGIPGLPARMGMIRVTVRAGLFADFGSEAVREAWGADLRSLHAEQPTTEEWEACHRLGRNVRAVADFLRAPSARNSGDNIPLFIDGRADSELLYDLSAAETDRSTPVDLRQQATEQWDQGI